MVNVKSTLVYLPDNRIDHVSWLQQDATGVSQSGRGSLADVATGLHGKRLTLLIPGDSILTHAVDLPIRQSQRLRQAVPYALEERFAEDIDGLHFALGQRQNDGSIPVVVLSKALIDRWLQQLAAADLRADTIVPDVLAVPLAAGEWSLLLSDTQVLLRMGPVCGWVFPAHALSQMLPLALADAGLAKPERIQIYDCRQATAAEVLDSGAWAVPSEINREADPLQVLQQGIAQGIAINLLQGEFSPREQYGRLWRPWRMTAVLLLLSVLLQGGMWLQRLSHLKGEEQQLYAQIEAVYREAFPNAKNIVNPQVQMERELAQIRSGGQASGFGSLFVSAAPVLSTGKGSEVRSFRFQQGSLDVELTLSDLAALDALKQALIEQGLEVTIQTASAQGDKVEGRIQIREGRS